MVGLGLLFLRLKTFLAVPLVVLFIVVTGFLLTPSLQAFANTDAELTPGWEQYGTCEWKIDASGGLSIRPLGNGQSGVLGYEDDWGNWRSPHALWEDNTSIKSVTTYGNIVVYGCNALFKNCTSIITADLTSFDTSKATDLSRAFYGCTSLKYLNISTWDTSGIEDLGDMEYMFRECPITTLLLGNKWKVPNGYRESDGLYLWNPRGANLTSFWTSSNATESKSLTTEQLIYEFNPETMAGTWTAQETTVGWKAAGSCEWNIDNNGIMTIRPAENGKSGALRCQSQIPRYCEYSDYYYDGDDMIWWEDESSIRSVVSNGNIKLKSCRNLFSGCTNLSSANISNWDTSEVEDMCDMFRGCSKLTDINFSNWDVSNVTDMDSMFFGCSRLRDVDFSKWNVSNVTSMREMFHDCPKLSNIDMTNWNVSSLKYIGSMFYGCSSLTSLNLSRWNTSNLESVTRFDRDGDGAFYNCSSLTSLNLANWNVSKVTNMCNLFHGCSSLKTLNLSGWDTSNVTDMSYMFSGCASLVAFPVFSWNTSSLVNMCEMFSNCTSMTSLDLSRWNTRNLEYMGENGGKGYGAFRNCTSLTTLNLANWDVTGVRNMVYVFSGCSKLKSLNLTNWNPRNAEEMDYLFSGCSSLINLDVSKWNTFEAISMRSVFSGCSSLTTLDVSKWDTSSVSDMYDMFYGCTSLPNLNISNWDVSKVTNMESMFNGCSSLTSLEIPSWNVAKVTNMYEMFRNCESLKNIDLSKWNTSKVLNLNRMFYGCSSLTTLNLSKWDTSSVTRMSGVFWGCSSLKNIDVSEWNTTNVTDLGSMFSGCSSLLALDLAKWNTRNATDMNSIFYSCSFDYLVLGVNWTVPLDGVYTGETWLRNYWQNGEGQWFNVLWESSNAKNPGPFTSEQLMNNYDPKTMAGTWTAQYVPYQSSTPAPVVPNTPKPSIPGSSNQNTKPTVIPPIMSVYAANASTGALSLTQGKSIALKGTAVVVKAGQGVIATGKVKYVSSNLGIAAVSASGKVIASKKKTGTAKITITSVDNPANKKIVTVKVVKKAKYKAATAILKTNLKTTYKASATKQIKVLVKKWSPASPSNKNYVVSVTPKSKVNVDSATNKVTFLKKGTVKVTIKSTTDPKAKMVVKVKIK